MLFLLICFFFGNFLEQGAIELKKGEFPLKEHSMKIQPSTLLKTTRINAGKPSVAGPASPGNKVKFDSLMDKLRVKGGDLHAEMVQFRDKIVQGKEFNHQELLYYQVRAGEFGMKVELYSKLAESLSSTLKRFQQGQ